MAHVVNPATDVGYHHDPHYDHHVHHVDRYHTVYHEATPVEHYTAPLVAKHEHFTHPEDFEEYRREKYERKEQKRKVKE